LELTPQTPDSLTAFLQSAPASVTKTLVVLSAAVSLTDDIASTLISDFVPSNIDPESIISCLRMCDFVVERNSEWHIEQSVRSFLLKELHKEPELTKAVHTTLQRIAQEANPSLAGDTVPAYLTWQIGLAYHTTVFNAEVGLNLYTESYTGKPTGDQWLLGVLSEEQQEHGFIPAQAIEPSFFRGMSAYQDGRWEEAESYFRRVVQSDVISHEISIASHLLGRILHLHRHRDSEA
jgi:hypothetical protein